MPTKILYLSNSIIPSQYANSVHVMKMCQALSKNNFDVDLLFYTNSNVCDSDDIFKRYGVTKEFGLTPLYVRSTRGKFFRKFFDVFRFLNKNHRETLVYGRDIYSVYLASLLGFRVYFESHGLPVSMAHAFIERLLFKSEKLVELIVISDKLRELYLLREHTIASDKVRVLHDGADAVTNNNTKNLGPGFHVGYVGSLYYRGRGIDLILDVAKRNLDLMFHLVGGKQEEVTYWQRESSSNVKFHGFLPNNEATDYLLGFDAVLMPYQKDLNLEGMKYNTIEWMSPMKMFEYMSASKAIVSSDLPVIREVLNPQNSMLVEYDDREAWSSALRKLYTTPKMLNSIGIKAHQDFSDKYSWDERVKSLNLK